MVFITSVDSRQIILMSSGSVVNISRMGNICLWLTSNLTLPLCMPLSASLSDSLNTNVTTVTIIFLLLAWGREITVAILRKTPCLPALAQQLTHPSHQCFFFYSWFFLALTSLTYFMY